METKVENTSDKHTLANIIDICSQRVVGKLSFSFSVGYRDYTSCISKKLAEKIQNEFNALKKWELNKIQLKILSRLDQHNINSIGQKLAGDLKLDPKGFAIVLNDGGVTRTGMIDVYYRDLDTKALSFLRDLVTILPYRMSESSGTNDNLNGKRILRQKKFILELSKELINYATYGERIQLLNADSAETITCQLAKERSLIKQNYGITNSYGEYLDAVAYSQTREDMIALLLIHLLKSKHEKTPVFDLNVITMIINHLSKQDLNIVQCTNRFFKNIRAVEFGTRRDGLEKEAGKRMELWNNPVC